MLWPEKTLILAVLAGVLYLLGALVCVRTDPERPRPERSVAPASVRLSHGHGSSPCPTCYMTRAFVLMAHGRVADAVVFQPLGAVPLGGAGPGRARAAGRTFLAAIRVALTSKTGRGGASSGFLFLFALASWGYTIVREIWPGSAAG